MYSHGPATAAIAALAFTLGAWVLDFMAVEPGAWTQLLADLSPTAGLRSFERGLLSLPAALGILIVAMTLLALTTVWLSPGRSIKPRAALSVGAVVGGIVLALVASNAGIYVDVTEDRRNSFAPADEAALRKLAAPLTMWSPAAAANSPCRAASASHSGVPGVWADVGGSSSSASHWLPEPDQSGSNAW